MTSPNAEGQSSPPASPLRRLSVDDAIDRYLAYRDLRGEEHALLARYAVFPLILTPELVNLIHINFLGDARVPWEAEPDLLLSDLCHPIGGGLYEVDATVREVMLVDLIELNEDRGDCIRRLADFLLAYTERQAQYQLPPEIVRVYRWIAWSILDPARAAEDMAQLLDESMALHPSGSRNGRGEQIQVTLMLLDVLTAPLEAGLPDATYHDLMAMADVLANYLYRDRTRPPVPLEPGVAAAEEDSLLGKAVRVVQKRRHTAALDAAESGGPLEAALKGAAIPYQRRVRLDLADPAEQRGIAHALAPYTTLLEIAGPEESGHYVVQLSPEGAYQIARSDGAVLVRVASLARSGEEERYSAVAARLVHLARMDNLCSMRSERNLSDFVELALLDAATGVRIDANGGATVQSGTELHLRVSNGLAVGGQSSDVDDRLYLLVLHLAADWTISCLNPSDLVLGGGKSVNISLKPVLPEGTGELNESFQVFCVPVALSKLNRGELPAPLRTATTDEASIMADALRSTDWAIGALPMRILRELPAQRLEGATPTGEAAAPVYGGGPVAIKSKLWKPGQTLRVAFMDGDAKLQAKVLKYAREWSQYANIHFELTDNLQDAELRVTLNASGNWAAYVGNDCLLPVLQGKPTISLGQLGPWVPEQIQRGVALHVFGHVLGLVNACLSPIANIPWDMKATYQYYRRTQNWDERYVDFNLLTRLDAELTIYGEIDNKSIMMPEIRKELTSGLLEVGVSLELSDGDKALVARLYPYERQAADTHDTAGQQSQSAKLLDPAPSGDSELEPDRATELLPSFGVKAKLWKPGIHLRIRFIEGDPTVHDRVVEAAREWETYANIYFDRSDDPEAEVRIGFNPRGGAWSFFGTDALLVSKEQPTMNLGWLKPNTAQKEYERVVLHVFGRLLGLTNEHQSPNARIPWDERKVIDYYRRVNGWDEAYVRSNILDKPNPSSMAFEKPFDPYSIMLYPIPKELTQGGYEIPWSNTTLSRMDKEAIGWLYPLPYPGLFPLPYPGTHGVQFSDNHNLQLWKPGQSLHVRFLNGESELQTRVLELAQTWCKYANIQFVRVDDPGAELRISFGEANWACRGLSALRVPLDRPTMGLSFRDLESDPIRWRAVVLRQFGTALGLILEHQSPVAGIPWDTAAVYRYYGNLGWSKEQVDVSILNRHPSTGIQYHRFDPTSIMCDPIPSHFTIGGFEITWINSELSETDKAFVAAVYPR